MTIQLHKTCDTLPIYNFYKIIETDDFNYLMVGYNDLNQFDGELDPAQIGANWNEILTEYSKLVSNKKIITNYEKQIQILGLEFDIKCITETLDNFEEFEDGLVLTLLENFGINIDLKKPIGNQIEMVVRKVKGLRNKVRILKVNYANQFGKEEKKQVKSNLVKEALSLEMSLEMGREIDVRTTSVSKWVYMVDMATQRQKEFERLKNK